MVEIDLWSMVMLLLMVKEHKRPNLTRSQVSKDSTDADGEVVLTTSFQRIRSNMLK